ncbi:MAG: DNA polymerase IV [Spirochaetaceae bacterium]|nr:DNA polymerase IV [Myxococcales bacterium]MCB9724612.1 DNA polymerase IV [Spirochaetaceae bacterium]
MTRPRCILHADMDAFYASVEQRDDPALRGRPIVVGGAGPRGVVAAASYEARVFGIRSAMPSVEARRLCPELVFVPGDTKRYAAESRRIFEIFGRYSPRVEGLSLDEAFLDLTGTERLLGPPRVVGERLRAEVRETTGLPVSVGIGPIKMVAKIASGAAKPDGLREVAPDEVAAFLEPLSVRRIWGVGPVAEERLLALGFRTIGDLARAGPEALRTRFGDWGEAIGRLARGVDLREVEPHREAVSLSEENTFEHDVQDRATLEATILTHAEAVARRLRREGLRARTVVLKWRLARRTREGARGYPARTRQRTLREPTDDGAVVAETARALLEDALAEPVRLLGVGVSGLVAGAASAGQLSLFAETAAAPTGPAGAPVADDGRRARLNHALDALADRFGDDAVRRASQAEVAHATLSGQWKRGTRDRSRSEDDEAGSKCRDARRRPDVRSSRPPDPASR